MSNATKYVDSVNGNDGNTGDSEAQAYQTLGFAVGAVSGTGNLIYVQAGGNYTLTSSITLNLAGTQAAPNRIEGYTTTPGSMDGRPTITSASNGVQLFSASGFSYLQLVHLNMTHTAATRGVGLLGSGGGGGNLTLYDCIFDGLLNAIDGTGNSISPIHAFKTTVKNCTSDGMISDAFNGGPCTFLGCAFLGNAGAGCKWNNRGVDYVYVDCLFAGNGGAGLDMNSARGIVQVRNCTFAGNTGSGFASGVSSAGDLWPAFVNSIFYGNGAYGIAFNSGNATDATRPLQLLNAFGGNTSGDRSNVSSNASDVSLSASPFANAGSGDYSLNATAGGGATCRAAGYPGAIPGSSTTGYLDLGAAQHQDAGGGTTVIGARPVVIQNIGTY